MDIVAQLETGYLLFQTAQNNRLLILMVLVRHPKVKVIRVNVLARVTCF